MMNLVLSEQNTPSPLASLLTFEVLRLSGEVDGWMGNRVIA